MRVALFLYRFMYLFALPFMLLRLLYRGFKQPAYWQRLPERFGVLPKSLPESRIWIHAVSVGEVKAAVILINHLRRQDSRLSFFVTTTTPTGSAQLKRELGKSVAHAYLPYDVSMFYQPIFTQIKPRILLIMETEVWANLMFKARQQGVPVVLVNARLSKKSARGYARIGRLAKPVFNQFTLILAQQKADARRIKLLAETGAFKPTIEVVGNIKFAQSIPDDAVQKGMQLRQKWGQNKQVIALASSHAGEEALLLKQLAQAHAQDLLLMLIPRHPERFKEVFIQAQKQGFNTSKRSNMQTLDAHTQVFVGDTMGEMMTFLAACDVTIMGGSLLTQGGHNPLEPAVLAKPVLMGPHYHNFQQIGDALIQAGAMQVVSPEQALPTGLTLLRNQQAVAMGQAGQAFVHNNSQAASLMTAAILRCIV